MRNIIISLVIFIIISVYSTFSYFFIDKTVRQIEVLITDINAQSSSSLNKIDEVEEIFSDKKNILLMSIDKEYILTIENTIVSLKTAIIYDDKQQVDELSKHLELMLTEIRSSVIAL